MMFDGWSTVRHDAVLGFMVSYLEDYLYLNIRLVGNIRVQKSHREEDMYKAMTQDVSERLGQCVPDYFVSDSAAGSNASVCLFMKDEGVGYNSLALFTFFSSLRGKKY